MSTALTLQSIIGNLSSYTNTDSLGIKTTLARNLQSAYSMTYGATTDDANDTTSAPTFYYENKFTLTVASSVNDIDLLALVDQFGNSLATMTKIYEILIHNEQSRGGSGLLITPSPSNGWKTPFGGNANGEGYAAPGGNWHVSSPYAGLSIGTNFRKIRVTNDVASPTGPVTFDLILYGGP